MWYELVISHGGYIKSGVAFNLNFGQLNWNKE